MTLQPITTPLTYDYSRSFIQWDSSRDNIPRCTVHASCRLRPKNGTEREFFLSHPCAGEQMYATDNLIHQPVAEFHMVCESGKEFMHVKVHADDPVELRMAHRVGEVVPTKDGKGSLIARVDVTMRRFPSVRELRTDREVHDAMIANEPIMGRTQFTGDDGETLVISEYPITVMNARPSDRRFQVDTGPILVPDFSVKHELTGAMFRQAFIVYNTWDRAEIAVRQSVPSKGGRVVHYGSPKKLAVRNQLFAATP
jgi:hypothetical protein